MLIKLLLPPGFALPPGAVGLFDSVRASSIPEPSLAIEDLPVFSSSPTMEMITNYSTKAVEESVMATAAEIS